MGDDLTTQAVKTWATPNAGDFKAGMSTGRQQKSLGQDVHSQLEETKTEKWATPVVTDSFGARNLTSTRPPNSKHHAGVTLGDQTLQVKNGKVEKGSPKLNPRWVETLMGLPLGWCCPNTPDSIIKNWRRFLIGCVLVQAELKNSGCSETE